MVEKVEKKYNGNRKGMIYFFSVIIVICIIILYWNLNNPIVLKQTTIEETAEVFNKSKKITATMNAQTINISNLKVIVSDEHKPIDISLNGSNIICVFECVGEDNNNYVMHLVNDNDNYYIITFSYQDKTSMLPTTTKIDYNKLNKYICPDELRIALVNVFN